MSAPTVVGTNHGAQTSNATSHVFKLPDGCGPGDRVLFFVAMDNQQAITWPGGWTPITQADGPAGNTRLLSAYRDLDGSEGFDGTGDTITGTVSTADESSHTSIAYAAGTFDPAIAPEAVINEPAGTGTTGDPAAITPAGGPKDFAVVAAIGVNGTITVDSGPAGYDNFVADTCANANGTGVGLAQKGLTAATTENPGTFGLSAATQRELITVAIHPISAGGGSGSAVQAILTEGY